MRDNGKGVIQEPVHVAAYLDMEGPSHSIFLGRKGDGLGPWWR